MTLDANLQSTCQTLSELKNHVRKFKELEIHWKEDRKYLFNIRGNFIEKHMQNSSHLYNILCHYHSARAEVKTFTRRSTIVATGGVGVVAASIFSMATLGGGSVFLLTSMAGVAATMISAMGISGNRDHYKNPNEHLRRAEYYKIKVDDYNYFHGDE